MASDTSQRIIMSDAINTSEVSEIDSDVEPEVEDKKYFTSFSDNIKQATARRKFKCGIKRHPGHFQLNCRTHSNKAEKPGRYYDGKNYNTISTDRLHRATPHLTKMAIAKEVSKEQSRRSSVESEELQAACKLYSTLNHEFQNCISTNEDISEQKIQTATKNSEDNKEKVLSTLLYKFHEANQKVELEDERKRRLQVLNVLTMDDEEIGQSDDRDLIQAMSETNENMAMVQLDLLTAIKDLEEEEETEKETNMDRARDMKDICTRELFRAMQTFRSQAVTENERQRRMANMQLNDDVPADKIQKKSMDIKDFAHEEMIRLFAGVKKDESQAETVTEASQKKLKKMVLETMMHKTVGKQVDDMCARERASRIREAELNRTDPYQEKVKDNWVKIVEEMLVKRFHGVKKVAWDPVVEDKGISESEQDRKIRQIRTRSRRQSTIIVED